MKAYPEYKSVSAEEKIIYPSHWQCVKPKFFVSLDKGRKPNDTSFDNTGLPPYLTMDVLRGRDTLVQYPFSSENLLEVHDNDTLILWDGANAGEVMVGKHGFLSSTMALVNFDSTKFNKFFILYLLKSKEPIFKLKASGTTIPHFDGKYFLDTPIAFPNYDEQTAIAEYLDEVTGKIDALVDEKQAQVDELRAYRTSLITETVTRGLNPDAPLRPSGIDWLGDIPQHWETSKLKYIGEARNGLTYSPDDICEQGKGVLVLRSSNIQNEQLCLEDNVYVSKEVDELMMKEGDILICSRNGSASLVGKCAIIPKGVNASFGAFMMRYRSIINKRFTLYLVRTTLAQHKAQFATSTINQLTNAMIGNMQVAVPPLAEQQSIADFLDAKTAKIDELISELTKQIDELTEYKQAVITEAVTGKVDVRDYKPSN